MSPGGFLVVSLGFSVDNMSSTDIDSFTSSFPDLDSFYLFFLLLLCLGLPNLCWMRVIGVGLLLLFMI